MSMAVLGSGTRVRFQPMTAQPMTLGHWLKTRREAAGVTQRQVSVALDVDQTYVSKIERGIVTAIPTPEQARVIAELLGTTVEDMWLSLGYHTPTGDTPAQVFTSLKASGTTSDLPESVKRIIEEGIEYAERRYELERVPGTDR